MTTEAAVLAVVVATRGGARLDAVLASLAWAGERAVLDVTGDVSPAQLPSGVRLGRDAAAVAALGTAPWLLLLGEDEEGPAREAVAPLSIGAPAGYRPRLHLEVLGVTFVLGHAAIRLAPRQGCRLTLDRTLGLGLAPADVPLRSLAAAVRRQAGGSVTAAVAALEPESRTLSALLAQLGAQPGAMTIALAPVAALARVLFARATSAAGLARWVAAMFSAYRVVLAHIRLWEWRHTRPAEVREVA